MMKDLKLISINLFFPKAFTYICLKHCRDHPERSPSKTPFEAKSNEPLHSITATCCCNVVLLTLQSSPTNLCVCDVSGLSKHWPGSSCVSLCFPSHLGCTTVYSLL